MNQDPKTEEKYQQTQKIYKKINKVVEKRDFNFLGDDSLKKQIQYNYTRIQKRIDLKMTICAIFDTRNRETRLIDGLIKERISGHLNQDSEYVIQVQGSNQPQENHIDKKMKAIYASVNKWKSLGNSTILLSPDDYTSYAKKLKKQGTLIPDLIILVLRSPRELEDEKIQIFMQKIGRRYRNGNFILVFNDAAAQDCTSVLRCNDCFPERVKGFLSATNIKFENRIFKVSSLINFDLDEFENIRVDQNSNTFKELRQTINEELDINTVMKRLDKDAHEVKSLVNDIKKTFDEREAKENIYKYEQNLQQKSKDCIEKIDNIQRESIDKTLKKKNNTNEEARKIIKQAYKEFKENFGNDLVNLEGNVNNINDKKSVGNNIQRESIDKTLKKKNNTNEKARKNIKQACKEFKENFGNDLVNLEGNVNNINDKKSIGNLAKDMFFNEYMKDEAIEGVVNYNFRHIKPENDKEKRNNIKDVSNKKRQEELKQATLKTLNNIFEMVKKAFLEFINSFRFQAIKNVEKIKKTVEESVEILKNVKGSMDDEKSVKKLKGILKKEVMGIQQKFEDTVAEIQCIIGNLETQNIYPKFIGLYIIEKIDGKEMSLAIKNIKTKLKFYIESSLSKKPSNRLYKSFQKSLDNFYEGDGYADSCHNEVAIFLATLTDLKYYENWLEERYIKKTEMVSEIKKLEAKLLTNLIELNDKLNNLIDETTKIPK